MRNTLGDLSLHLFAQLERLGDEDLSGEKLAAKKYTIGKKGINK